MLQTHHSSILFSHAALSNVGNHPTALSINLPSSLVDQGRRKQESPDSAALRHAYNIAVASTLSIIFQNACRRAGWEGLDRQCHNHQVVDGANFSNPLAVGSGQDDQPTWFYSRAPGMSIYRRNAMTWRYSTAECRVPFGKEIRIAGIKLRVLSSTARQIPIGAEVYLFVEIMDTGLVHKYPWARLPDIGCLSDHRDALRLGLRFEWNDSGQWKSIQWLYGRKQGLFYPASGYYGEEPCSDRGAFMSYVKAMTVINVFDRVDWNPKRPYHRPISYPCITRFDSLTQSVKIVDTVPSRETKPVYYLHQSDTEVQLLEAAGPGDNTAIGRRPREFPLSRYPGDPRRVCDACFLAPGSRNSLKGTCVISKESADACQDCYQRGL
jgi:hypothetical protein